MKKIFSSLFLLCFIMHLANATTYYVGPGGNNGNNGLSSSSAFQTIQYAIEYVGSHGGPVGNEVILLSGSWPAETTIPDVSAANSWSSNLLIRAATGQTVNLNRISISCSRITIKGVQITSVFHYNPSNYVTLEDVVGIGGAFWSIESASNVTWRRCQSTDAFTGTGDRGQIKLRNTSTPQPQNILIEDCCFSGSSTNDGNHIDCIQIMAAIGLTIRNCNIYHAPTGVIMMGPLGGGQIKNVLFENCWFGDGKIYVANEANQNLTVRNCTIEAVMYKTVAGTNTWTGNKIGSWLNYSGYCYPSTFQNNTLRTNANYGCALPATNTINANVDLSAPPCSASDPDTEAPSVPIGLSPGTVTGTTIALSWNAATDNIGVTGYKVYTNGANPVSVSGTSATITGLNPTTQYSLTVSAYDGSGNESNQSSALIVSTIELDTQAPSVPTGLSTGTVTTSSVALSWTASTDNVGVTGYKVYTNGANSVSVTGTSATINNLADNTPYSFTVSAVDGEGNESAQSSSVNATTIELTGVISSGTWQSFTESTQTGTFTATFDAVPNSGSIDAITGIQNGTAAAYGDLACIVRFNTSGQIDARNGGAYAATNTISYTSGVNYHFRVEVDLTSHIYSVYVTPQGGSEQTVASNFAFRSEQASVSQLTGWSVYAVNGSHAVDNMDFSGEGGTDTEAPGAPTGFTVGTITTSSVALSWNASTDNVGVTGYKVYTNNANPVTTGSTSITISGLSSLTQYSFTVIAYDAAGNESAQSSAVTATTLDGGSANEYYVDPATGSMSNPGTSSQPWSTLEAVFTAGKTFQAGDIIYLLNGYHGYPTISGNNSDYVTIMAEAGHTPGVKKLNVANASKWIISDLNVSPELVSSYERGDFVTIQSTSSYITIQNCNIYSAQSISGWTSTDMSGRLGNGMVVNGPNCLITNNTFKNTNFTLSVNKTSTGTNVTYNTIDGFMGDAMRGLASYCKFEYNVVKTCYGVDANHDDAFQSWSTNASGTVGAGTVYNVELRGNIFINQVDANQPFPPNTYGMQGIGNFDGFFENWIIENNLVVTDMWHGLSFYGARNCVIVNNTVVKNNINILGDTPWIAVYNHKNGTASTGNIMNNNLTCNIASSVGCSLSNNIVSSDYTNLFENYAGYDFHLKSGSTAVDSGTSSNAPSTDLDGNSRPAGAGYDVGCYEYNGEFYDETSVTVSPATTSIEAGLSATLTATVEPANASNKNVSWSSNNPSVATVNTSGEVFALAEGTAIITATTDNLGLTSTCTVTVTPPSTDYNLAIGKSVTVTAEQTPDNIGSKLVDNNTDDASRWSADGFPQSATIDLGEECDLSQIEVYTYQSRAYQYIIEASSDGSNFSQIVDRSSNTTTSQPIADAITATGRYVKITVSGASGYTGTWVSITELKAIGMTATEQTQPNNQPTIDVISDVNVLDNAGQQTINLSGISDGDGNTQIVSVVASSSDVNIVNNVSVNYTSGNSTGTLYFTPVAAGTATITVTVSDNGGTENGGINTKVISFDVVVEQSCPALSEIDFSEITYNLDVAETAQTQIIITPVCRSSEAVTYSSSNASIAIVNTSGLITAVGPGTATITVTTADGGFTTACAVTVINQPEPVVTNLALNKPITVSAYQDDSYGYKPGENLVDGDVSDDARWSAGGFPQWAEIDLGQNCDLTSINLYPYQNRAYQYIIEAKADGGSYTTIVNRSSNTESADVLSDNVSGVARYVKISVSGLSGSTSTWVSLSELEVMGMESISTIVNVTDVVVSPTSLSLEVGQTSDLNETVSPANATDQTVVWTSDNTSVATVDQYGNVTAITEGTATITVTTNDGGYNATCVVTVINPTVYVTGVSISASTLSMDAGQTYDLDETVSPSNATDQTVVWTTNNSTVATVDQNGNVTAISEGTATITVTTNDGAYTATCIVTVTEIVVTTGTITRDYWTSISGSTVADLVNNANYPDNPTGSDELTTLEGVDWNNPTVSNTWAQVYGERIYGYLVPPTTGDYTFWISGDDVADLYLSTNDDPANKVKIAYLIAHSQYRSWSEFASQKSVSVSLVAGQRYFIEVLHKESYGNDYVAVGWAKPGESTAAPSEIIPGSALSPYLVAKSIEIAKSDKMENIISPTMQIWPNPVSIQELNVNLRISDNDETTLIKLFDMTGKLVYINSFIADTDATQTINIPINNLKKGMYIISADSNGKSKKAKIIIR